MIEKVVNVLKQKLFYNSVLRLAMQSYFKLSLIGFYNIQLINSTSSLVTGIIMIVFASGFPIFAFVFLKLKLSRLGDSDF